MLHDLAASNLSSSSSVVAVNLRGITRVQTKASSELSDACQPLGNDL